MIRQFLFKIQQYKQNIQQKFQIFTLSTTKQKSISIKMLIFRRNFIKYSFSGVNQFDSSKDYYKLLGLSLSANSKQIKKSFRDLAKKYHPDSSKGNEQKFKQVNQAYQVLSDDKIKNQYDQARSYQSTNQQHQQYHNYTNNNNNNHNNNQKYYQQSYQQQQQNYRGYTRPDGWKNQKYRQEVMNQIFKQYQRQYERKPTSNNPHENYSNPSSFGDSYTNHAEHIRQYTEHMKIRQESIRKAYQQQEERRQRQYREHQEQQMRDLQQLAQKKVNDLKDGLVKNMYGFIKVGEFLKDTWKNITNDKFNKNGGKK